MLKLLLIIAFDIFLLEGRKTSAEHNNNEKAKAKAKM